jgi:hypothetical protein
LNWPGHHSPFWHSPHHMVGWIPIDSHISLSHHDFLHSWTKPDNL